MAQTEDHAAGADTAAVPNGLVAHDLAVSRPAPGVLELRLHRPRAANALSTMLLASLADTLEASAADDAVRAVVLTGGATLFSVGADPAAIVSPPAGEEHLAERTACHARIARFPKPLVAAVCGPAIGGGCELVLAADLVIAGESARFALPETALGLIPGAGGTQRLVRTVGKPLAMQMILAGTALTATDALRSGLVGEVVADEACLPRARALAHAIASRPARAVRLAKKTVLEAWELPLAEGLARERLAFLDLIDSLRGDSLPSTLRGDTAGNEP
jgi:enoyl-CoA hydratase